MVYLVTYIYVNYLAEDNLFDQRLAAGLRDISSGRESFHRLVEITFFLVWLRNCLKKKVDDDWKNIVFECVYFLNVQWKSGTGWYWLKVVTCRDIVKYNTTTIKLSYL